MLHDIPTWLMALLVSGAFVALTLAAIPPVNRFWPPAARRGHNDIAGFIIAVVGVLYAVLLASIAILALETWSRAEAAVEREASMLGDLYRDAGFLPAPVAAGLRGELRAYAQAALEAEWPAMRAGDVPEAGWPILERAQSVLFRFKPAAPMQESAATQMLADLDALDDARRERLLVAFHGVEPVVWAVVLWGAAATLAFSLIFGVENRAAHMAMAGLLAFSLSLVIILILAVDQPLRGDGQISSEPFRVVLGQFDRLDAAPRS